MLDLAHGFAVRWRLTLKEEVTAGLNLMDKSLARRRAVRIDHYHADVLDFLVHHPWHDAHNHDGEHDDEPGQERIAPYL